MTTHSYTNKEVEQKWYLVDAKGKVLGRLATEIATIIRGKNKPQYSPNADLGDFVVVINIDKVKLTGSKLINKIYYKYSGYPGGLKEKTAKEVLEKDPAYILYHAVKGMLPKNKLARQVIKKLKVYAGEEHPHFAQQPEKIDI